MRFDHTVVDPRAKLAFAAAVSVVAIVIPELPSFGALALILAAVVAYGRGFGLREWIGSLAPLKLLVPIILVLNSFFYGGGTVLWTLSGTPLNLTVGGIHASAVIAARLLVLAGVASWFALTTETEAFEVALTRLGVPWSFAFLLSLTLRLVPEMRSRFHTIEEAQRSRGLEISGHPLQRARARIPMLVPFLASVIQYGYDLAEALEARDYGAVRDRTSVVTLTHHRIDYVFYVVSIALVAGFWRAFLY